MDGAEKKREKPMKNQVIVFSSRDDSGGRVCEIMDVKEIVENRLVTEKCVLPLSDAEVYNSSGGMIYAYNVSFEYLTETQHLAEVEKNIIVRQAFDYPNRTEPKGSANGLMIAGMIIAAVVFIVAIIA